MSQPVDLTNIRDITDGDVALEKELFNEFIATSDSYINELGRMLSDDMKESWRTTAHAFKGIALNLGAEKLGSLCKIAQEGNVLPEQEKVKMLGDIKQEYSAVRNYLKSLM